jgi:hypothetical protein
VRQHKPACGNHGGALDSTSRRRQARIVLLAHDIIVQNLPESGLKRLWINAFREVMCAHDRRRPVSEISDNHNSVQYNGAAEFSRSL